MVLFEQQTRPKNNTSPSAGAVPHLLNHGVDPRVSTDLLVHHALELAHDLENGIPRLSGVLLVPGDRDDAGVLRLHPRKLDLDTEVISDLGDNGAATSDDLGMVVRVYLDFHLEGFLELLLLLILKLRHLLGEPALDSLNVGGDATDEDDVGLYVLAGDTDVDVKLVHHVTDAGALLSGELEGDGDLGGGGDQLEHRLGGGGAVLRPARDLHDVRVGGAAVSVHVVAKLSSIVLHGFVGKLVLNIEVCRHLLNIGPPRSHHGPNINEDKNR